jgi:hypothetical protein
MKPNMLIQAIINGSYGTTFLHGSGKPSFTTLCCLTCLMRPCHCRGNCTWCLSGISLAGLP